MMKFRLIGFATLVATAGLVVATAYGDAIAIYNFTGQATANGQDAATGQAVPSVVNGSFLSSASAISTPDNSDATGVRLQYRFTGGSFANLPGSSAEFPTLEGRVTTAAPDPNKYFAFSMVANSNFNLNSLTFDLAEGATNAADLRGAQVLMSLNDFATSIDVGTRNVTDPASAADVYEHFSLSLLNTPVTSGQTVSFRFLPFVSTGNAGGVRFDNISVFEGLGADLPGDVNGDNMVDGEDFAIIKMNFGNTGVNRGDGDLTLDGAVDFDDFRQWKSHATGAGASSSLEGVPEPTIASLLLIELGGLSLIRFGVARRR